MKKLLPPRCVLCSALLCEGFFCNDCFADLPWIDVACKRCGQQMTAGDYCGDCQLKPPAFERAVAPLLYDVPVDSALKALKFRRQLFHAPAFGELLLPPYLQFFSTADALLPVPLHRRRHAMRGFNQAMELCRPLRRQSGLPFIRNVARVKFTAPQTGLDATQRRQNMKSAFRVRGDLHATHPLVVDDVITTGETCNQLAAALLQAGASRVSVLAVARAASP